MKVEVSEAVVAAEAEDAAVTLADADTEEEAVEKLFAELEALEAGAIEPVAEESLAGVMLACVMISEADGLQERQTS